MEGLPKVAVEGDGRKAWDACNPRQQQFILNYIVSGVASQAYEDAGYVAGSADSNAYHLLRTYKISQALAYQRGVFRARLAVDREKSWLNWQKWRL